MNAHANWLAVRRGDAPLILSMPHAGTDIPAEIEARLASPWLARKDCDVAIDRLYDFADALGATVVRTAISRTVIDVNRDPGGRSLYPGQATTGLCPLDSFDGEPLYRPGAEPDADARAERQRRWFDPYHAALAAEIDRLRAIHPRLVLYDCHSIRSEIPRLFDARLPVFNIGTNGGASCDGRLTAAVEAVCRASGRDTVVDGRFRGGYVTRHYGAPKRGVHAIQMELAMRAYLDEPIGPVGDDRWPPRYDETFAAPVRAVLADVLAACLAFARP